MEGDRFGVADPVPAAPPADEAAPLPERADEGEAERAVRAAVRQQIGDHAYDAWLAQTRMQISGETLHIIARTAFDADWINREHAAALRRAAAHITQGQVRRAQASRERITA